MINKILSNLGNQVPRSKLHFADRLATWPSHKPLTAEDGLIDIAVELRHSLAIFKDGRLLVANGKKNDPYVRSAIQKAGTVGLRLKKPEFVSNQEIAQAYQHGRNENLKGNDDSAMRSLLYQLLKEASEKKASDIHIHVQEHETTIECRVQGKIEKLTEDLTTDQGNALSRAIYAACDPRSTGTNHQLEKYQSGAISGREEFKLPKNINSCRVQFDPTSGRGRFIVIRLFYVSHGDSATDLRELGYSQAEVDVFMRALAKPFGLICITGTTGSGKSTALQRLLLLLLRLHNGERRIITVEDPPEYPMPGIIQCPVADDPENRNRAYNDAIRAMLRSDPDVCMISELRDQDSAQMAFQAVMTGHPTFTTLHVTRAIDIAVRLLDDFKISMAKVSSHRNISLLVAQLLSSKICSHCAIPVSQQLDSLDDGLIDRMKAVELDLDTVKIRNPKGCRHCGGSGEAGRTVVAEFIEPDEGFMNLIRKGDIEAARRYWLTELNGTTLEINMINKVSQGLIDPREAEKHIGQFEKEMLLTHHQTSPKIVPLQSSRLTNQEVGE